MKLSYSTNCTQHNYIHAFQIIDDHSFERKLKNRLASPYEVRSNTSQSLHGIESQCCFVNHVQQVLSDHFLFTARVPVFFTPHWSLHLEHDRTVHNCTDSVFFTGDWSICPEHDRTGMDMFFLYFDPLGVSLLVSI